MAKIDIVSRRDAPIPQTRMFGLLGNSPLFYACLLYVLLTFILVPALLGRFVNYKETGGIIFEKIHPATYLIFLSLLLRGGRGKNALSLNVLNWITPLIFFLCAVYCLINDRPGFVGIIFDAMLAPNLYYVLQKNLSYAEAKRIAAVFIGLALLNLPVVLFEVITKFKLYPESGIEFLYENHAIQTIFRPAGLFEHPLMAGPVCFCAMLLIKNNAVRMPFLVAISLMIVLLFEVTLLSVRTPLLIAALIFIIFAAKDLKTTRGKIIVAAIVVAAPVVFSVLLEHGIFDRFIKRGIWGDDSSLARLTIFRAIGFMNDYEFWHGVSTDRAYQLMLDTGNMHNESFFVIALMAGGIALACVYSANIAVFLGQFMLREISFSIAIVIVAFSSNAFASKGFNCASLVMVGSFLWHRSRARKVDLFSNIRQVRRSLEEGPKT